MDMHQVFHLHLQHSDGSAYFSFFCLLLFSIHSSEVTITSNITPLFWGLRDQNTSILCVLYNSSGNLTSGLFSSASHLLILKGLLGFWSDIWLFSCSDKCDVMPCWSEIFSLIDDTTAVLRFYTFRSCSPPAATLSPWFWATSETPVFPSLAGRIQVFLCCWTILGWMNLAASWTQTAWGNWCGRFCDPTSWLAWSYLTLALTFFSTRVLSLFSLGILWWVLWYNIVLLNQLIQTKVALPGAAVLALDGLLPSSSISSPSCLPGRLSDLWLFYIAFLSCLDNHEPWS